MLFIAKGSRKMSNKTRKKQFKSNKIAGEINLEEGKENDNTSSIIRQEVRKEM